MTTNQKGYIGLSAVIKDLSSRGLEVFLPVHDYSAVDLLVMNESGIVKRLQVKYREARNGSVVVPLTSVVNGKHIKIDKTRIDGWAVYVPELDKVVYVPSSVSKDKERQLTIRVQKPKSNNGIPSIEFDKFSTPNILW
jgi:hypothetical protein